MFSGYYSFYKHEERKIYDDKGGKPYQLGGSSGIG